MTSQWPDNCDAITRIVIFNSLDIDFIHGDIHGRSCKKLVIFPRNKSWVKVFSLLTEFSHSSSNFLYHFHYKNPFSVSVQSWSFIVTFNLDKSSSSEVNSQYDVSLGPSLLKGLLISINPCGTEIISVNINIWFHFLNISQHWDVAGSWDTSPGKMSIFLSYLVNSMVVDGLATQGARASTAVVLTLFLWIISVSASEGWSHWGLKHRCVRAIISGSRFGTTLSVCALNLQKTWEPHIFWPLWCVARIFWEN